MQRMCIGKQVEKMKIKSITYSGKSDVYNLEVEDTHSFAVENGTIVHNCADECRYFCMARPIKARIVRLPKPKLYNPLDTEQKIKPGLGFLRL